VRGTAMNDTHCVISVPGWHLTIILPAP
jgi:hypothetical protein